MSVPGFVASDLDGTLLGADGRISARTRAAVERVAEQGTTFVAATGRSHQSVAPLFAGVQRVEWAVCSNGAMRFHLPTQSVVSFKPMAADVVDSIRGGEHGIDGLALAWEDSAQRGWTHDFVSLFPGYFKRVDASTGLVAAAVPSMADGVKIMAAHPELSSAEVQAALADHLGDRASVCYSGAAFCEVTAPGADKGTALAELACDLGLADSESLAFGDQNNDLTMIRWATTGVAMARAHPELVADADDRAGDHAEDGVAAYLEQRFGLGAT